MNAWIRIWARLILSTRRRQLERRSLSHCPARPLCGSTNYHLCSRSRHHVRASALAECPCRRFPFTQCCPSAPTARLSTWVTRPSGNPRRDRTRTRTPSPGWMMIGTSSASSGSTLTWLVETRTAVIPIYSAVSSCALPRISQHLAWGTINEHRDYQAPFSPVPVVHVISLKTSFLFLLLSSLLCGPPFSSPGRLHLMCSPVFHGIHPRHPLFVVPYPLLSPLICTLVMLSLPYVVHQPLCAGFGVVCL